MTEYTYTIRSMSDLMDLRNKNVLTVQSCNHILSTADRDGIVRPNEFRFTTQIPTDQSAVLGVAYITATVVVKILGTGLIPGIPER